MKDERGTPITRREALRKVGAAGAAAAVAPGALTGAGVTPAGADPARGGASPGSEEAVGASVSADAAAVAAPRMVNLTASETEILSAMVDRLIPTDELGPGAIDAGVLEYIDRALGEAVADAVDEYRAGLAALDRYSRSSRGAPFVELGERDRDSVLIDVQTGAATGAGVGFQGSSASFFTMVQGHTWQGMFGDPRYGGNRDFAGWDLLRYPGPRMRVTEEEQDALEAGELPPARTSAYGFGLFQNPPRG